MGEIFLSASVPVPGRGNYYDDSDPFLIQFAVREFLTVVLGRRRLVWGGHPAITPMVWSVCQDIGVEYADAVQLYQSRLFEDFFPRENKYFKNTIYTDAVEGDRAASIAVMRDEMLGRGSFEAAVFIGGMEGVMEEYSLFRERYPAANIVAISAGGGAARRLAQQLGREEMRIDFMKLFVERLGIFPTLERGRLSRI